MLPNMSDNWKTRCGPITSYLLLRPRGFEKCGVHSVETAHRDMNNGPPLWPRPQKKQQCRLKTIILDFSIKGIGPFMNDATRPHKSQLVEEYFQSEDMQRMEWHAMFPYLKPIKHVWDVLGRSITARRSASMTIDELKSALVQEWVRLPQGLIKTLVNSMKH
ncbi:transposable element Tcb2 transposase [Trichonephila clavipes]|uniref:Transposable element Tcb2 transposase n=1 Tax=Trichonephila clavipes TaxID=2585209 RepID=A0A8X6SGU2_TRICX|nr:transposable element Tcb2 transposase [Trichonephila clavipes]